MRYVLEPWLTAGDAGWEEARQALRRLGVEEPQALRREANRRLVPESALRSLLQAAHKEGRLAAAPGAAGRGPAWPLPEEEAGLVMLAERILALETLRELIRSQWQEERDQQLVCRELLERGVGSVSSLCERPPDALRPGLASGKQLSALLKEAAVRSSEDEAQRDARRCELQEMGAEPCLATAPHNAFLRRDGQPLHSLEEYTSMLARSIARELGGSVLCWSREAQWRTELRYSLGHRRKALGVASAVAEALDEANRDPNYLLPEELPGNAWFCKLKSWAAVRRGQCTLHVDVHGCQDPPKHPAYAMLGLAAMRQHAEALAPHDPHRRLVLSRMEAFAHALEEAVGEALAPVLGRPPEQVVTVTGLAPAVNDRGEHVMTLSGAWPPDMVRLTQTQQSVSYAGVTHALQLELGRSLRHALIRDAAAVARLARAIRSSWLQALDVEGAKP